MSLSFQKFISEVFMNGKFPKIIPSENFSLYGKLTKYAKICILMVSSVLHITSQVEHIKKRNSIDSESKSVKRNTDHQNGLTVCFYMLLQYYHMVKKHF